MEQTRTYNNLTIVDIYGEEMTLKELLLAQARTYVMFAKLCEENRLESSYERYKSQSLECIKKVRDMKEITPYEKIIRYIKQVLR